MTEEDKLNGYSIIQNVLTPPFTFDELMIKLLPGALEISKARIGTKNNQECQTIYNESGVDTFIWALGIMCQEWLLENLYRKSVNGHCHKHTLPCGVGAAFHKNLLKEYLKSSEKLLIKYNKKT